MKFRQGNVFTPVCYSVHREGLCRGGSLSGGGGGLCQGTPLCSNIQAVRILLESILVALFYLMSKFSSGGFRVSKRGFQPFGQIFLNNTCKYSNTYVFFLFSDVWSQNESFSVEAGRQKNGENKRLVYKQGSVNH